MDKKSQNAASTNIPQEASCSALSLSKTQSQNSFYVFGNVYVTNQSEIPRKKPQSSAFEIEVASNLNDINSELNLISDEMKNNQSLLLELKKAIEKREKRKTVREKVENGRDNVIVAEESVDFFHPNAFQPRVQEMKSQWEQLVKKNFQLKNENGTSGIYDL